MTLDWMHHTVWQTPPFPFVNFTLLLVLVVFAIVAAARLRHAYRESRDVYRKAVELLEIMKEYFPVLRAMKERSNLAVERVEESVNSMARGAEIIKKVVEESRSNGVVLTTPHVTVLDTHPSDEWKPGDTDRRVSDSGAKISTPDTVIKREEK